MEHHECCLFHGMTHKSEFQFILNFLRKNCVTVKIDFKRAAQLVCCCKLDHDSDESCQNLSAKGTSSEDQSSDSEVEKPPCKKQDGGIESVLSTNKIPGKVKVILENWMKRNSDAESQSHVHYGNDRISALMMLCLKGKYRPLLKMMVECSSREYVLIVPIPRKLAKPFFELDMKEMKEKLDFTFEVLNSPWTGLSINETFLKVTCDEENIKAVRILLVNEAKELVIKEKKAAMSAALARSSMRNRQLNDSGSATKSQDWLQACLLA